MSNVSANVPTDASLSTNVSPTANPATENPAPASAGAAKPASGETLCWLALALTEGLGPSRIRKLVEHFGTADRILQASLTELEATGMRAVSAQALATGKSLELAQDEVARAIQARATIISLSVWEELPADVQVALSAVQNESPAPESASLFPDDDPSPHEKKLLKLLKPDESTHIDELVEMLENEISSSEIFAALFELELSGKVRQLPGKNFVKSF